MAGITFDQPWKMISGILILHANK